MLRLLPTAIRRKVSAGAATPRGPRRRSTGLEVSRVSIALPHLPGAMDGMRIAHLSDLHLKQCTSEAQIEHAVEECNALKPDAIALTGDFMSFSTRHMGLLAELLSPLEAPHGIFAILGNHDFMSGPEEVEKRLKERRFTVLRNETRQIHTDGGVLHVAGADSRYAGAPDVRRTFAGWKQGQPLVTLMHEPDVVDEFAAAGVEGLQLSGHTHGGQIRIMNLQPMSMRLPRWGQKYVAGHYRVGSMQVYVNRGVGSVGVPLRLCCPPEVTEVTLRSAEADRA